MSDQITTAAVDYCWQQEQLAHAEFYHLLSEGQRRELAEYGQREWRGIMSPSLRRLIAALESEGVYDAGKLTEPVAMSKTLKVYKNPVYDYEIARRIEARKAEKKMVRA